MTFVEKLRFRQLTAGMVCAGLDTDERLIPVSVLEFNKAIIDKTCAYVCAYKFNYAFYARQREAELMESIEHINKNYPLIPVILDGKFGDIGNTSKMYAELAFEKYKADAVTVNPYLGEDALQPFLDREDKGIIVLCRTSNKGAKEFQDLRVRLGRKTVPYYQYVAHRVANYWNKNGNCLLVVGATYPKELGEVRRIVGALPILVPGVGEQSGDLQDVIKYGLDSRGLGLIINASRSIIYASKDKDFAEAAAREAKKLCDEINRIKEEVKNG